MHVFKVKTPARSKGRHDDYDLETVPPDQAFRPIEQPRRLLMK